MFMATTPASAAARMALEMADEAHPAGPHTRYT